MNEHLDQLEDSIRDIDKSLVQNSLLIKKKNSILSLHFNSTNNRCAWRNSSATKTTFEVGDLID
jgi:hypothetical protein